MGKKRVTGSAKVRIRLIPLMLTRAQPIGGIARRTRRAEKMTQDAKKEQVHAPKPPQSAIEDSHVQLLGTTSPPDPAPPKRGSVSSFCLSTMIKIIFKMIFRKSHLFFSILSLLES